ncbi:MAG: outer membrane lipoprotein-sorting protein [Nitrospinaceae bacterium]|jgi:outer membrane lipoprotein-sorting protein|nr:outer membrane lipoprotein-sorting protein [Nitrospinaceae bacterium]|tara:strand:- start:1217 stop:1999 length:783 start_codon:yes stop_codon:yes gene_type:complete
MKYIATLITLTILFSAPTYAETPEEKGLAIAKDDDKRDNGFQDFTSSMVMLLKNRQGEESSRHIRNKTLEVVGDGDKSISIFDRPRDVKGTALLNFTHKVGNDDQWLFLPALKRVKRISSANKSGSFMGSEFAYEDVTSQEVEKYTYKWIRDEDYKGEKCFVFERYPVYKNSGYTKQIVWLDQKEYKILRIEFFDRKKAPLKTLTQSDFKQYLGKYWYPGTMHMENHQTGKSTLITWKNYKFQNGLKDKDFNKNSLKRAR